MRIGVCGTGKMGAAITRRLMASGHQLDVWNRDPARTAPLVEAGATRAETPAALASGSDVVISMLLNDAAVEAVYRGRDGILMGVITGKLVIDMSTVAPETEETMAALVAEKGAAFVECPVGGTVGPARDGKLFGFAGGSDQDFARARPILERLCRRIEHVGPAGAGAKMKLAVNLPLLVYWEALGEALALCQPLGLPPERLIDILSDTSGTPAAMKARSGHLVKTLEGAASDQPSFDVAAARKDLAIMAAYGRTLGAPLPVTKAALLEYDAAIAAGLGGQDATVVAIQAARRVKS